MLHEVIGLGKYIYITADYAYQHRKLLGLVCGIYDVTKFAYGVVDKLQLLEYIPSRDKKNIVFIEKIGVERSDLGEFEIISN